jgi:hypothetical protein
VRALAFAAVLVLAGCERDLPALEAERAALARDEVALGVRLTSLSERVNDLRVSLNLENNRIARANSALHLQQASTVALWKGNPALLAEQKAKVKDLPKVLADALDLAQSAAGGEALERRFVAAVKRGELDELGPTLAFWENEWVAHEETLADEAPPKVCPTTRTLGCTPIDGDSLWCPDGAQNAGWAMVLEHGALSVGRLGGGDSHTVEARLAPRVWLTKVGSGDRGLLMVHTFRAGEFFTRWQEKLEKPGARLESYQSNVDADPWTEALFWLGDELTWVDPVDTDAVTVWRDDAACEAAKALETIPPPVRELCRKRASPAVDAGTSP